MENRREDLAHEAVIRWFRTGTGAAVADAESGEIGALLPELSVRSHLHLGGSVGGMDRATVRLFWDDCVVRAWPDALPLAAESVETVVLQHVLEFADRPHWALREAERVLKPEGHLVIFGFNPWSLWGVGRLVRRRGVPWCGHFYTAARLRDWLALLGLETVRVRRCGAQAVTGSWVLGRRWPWLVWPTWGRLGVVGVYVLIARKRVLPLTPLRPAWGRGGRRWSLAPDSGVATGRVCNDG